MTDYFAAEGPAWLWILATLALLAAGVAFGALMAKLFGLSRALESFRDHEARLARLEAPEPTPVRPEAPATIRDSIEISPEGDTLPGAPWFSRSNS